MGNLEPKLAIDLHFANKRPPMLSRIIFIFGTKVVTCIPKIAKFDKGNSNSPRYDWRLSSAGTKGFILALLEFSTRANPKDRFYDFLGSRTASPAASACEVKHGQEWLKQASDSLGFEIGDAFLHIKRQEESQVAFRIDCQRLSPKGIRVFREGRRSALLKTQVNELRTSLQADWKPHRRCKPEQFTGGDYGMSIPNVYEVAEQSRKRFAELLMSKATDLIQQGHVFAAASCLKSAVRFFDAVKCSTEAGYCLNKLRKLQPQYGPKTIEASSGPRLLRGVRVKKTVKGSPPVTDTRCFKVATCGISLDQRCIGDVLQSAIGEKYLVTQSSFQDPDELLRERFAFDLVILFLNPAFPTKRETHEFVSELKKESGPAVILLTNCSKYQMDSAEGFKRAGADGFFSLLPPFPTATFNAAVRAAKKYGR